MAIRKPSVSVEEAKRLAKLRPDADDSLDNSNSEVPAPKAQAAPATSQTAAPAPPTLPIGETIRTSSTPAFESSSRAIVSETIPAATLGSARGGIATAPGPAFSGLVFPEAEPEEPKLQVFLSAPLPPRGVSASYDTLSKQYSPTKALQMILRRALDDYETRLDDGSYQASAADYPIENKDKPLVIQTSRMMPVRLVEIARAHFDPLGFESTRAFGRKLACAALACFFEREGKRR